MGQTIETVIKKRIQKTIRPLTHQDGDALYSLQRANQDFYDLFLDHHLTKREAVNDLDEKPMNSAAGQKHYLGIFDGETLVATLDLVVDYPLPQVVWIGQFMWRPQTVSSTTAKRWLAAVLETLRELETVQVQLLVLDRDVKAQKFWPALGFSAVQKTQTMVMEQPISATIYQLNMLR